MDLTITSKRTKENPQTEDKVKSWKNKESPSSYTEGL
jgi:hypothetical protein